MNDVIDLLTRDHRDMEDRLKKILAASASDRDPLFRETADHLTAHVLVEEETFYPAVKAARTEDILLESLEEHLSLKRVLADLVELSPEDPHFEPKMHVLKEQVEHHHKEEEEHLFPKVKKLLSPESRQALGEEVAKRLASKIDRHPRHDVIDQTKEAAPLH